MKNIVWIFIITTSCLGAYAQKETKPNIIFILADDLGYGDLGSYGQKLIQTPNLDKMAANGMRFTQFYSGAPVCAPSRTSLMTGLHTGHTPIRGNKAVKPEGQWPLPATSVTIAEVMKQAGYATGDFGKWGMGFINTSGDPLNQGFDEFFGYNCQSEAHSYHPDHLWNNSKRIDFPENPKKENMYAQDLIHEKGLSFIDQNKGNPFFLYLSYILPHADLRVPDNDPVREMYKKKFNEVAIPKPLKTNNYRFEPYPKATYAAMVTRLDTHVGQVLDKLKALGIDKNTLVIFSSDNGPHVEGGNDPAFFNSNGGFRGVKRDVYEGGFREPFIAFWPGTVKAGSTNNHIGAFWDMLPTFAELAQTPAPENIDGISIVKTLKGKTGQKKHSYLYWEFHELGGRQAVRMGKWKGVKLNVITNPDAKLELYNLDKDPAEKNNIATKNPKIVEKINQFMRDSHVENEVFPFFAKK